MATSDDFDAKQHRVALFLATGSSVRAAARKTGVGARSIFRWIDNPAYRALIATLRDRVLSRTIGRLVRTSTRAVATLERLLKSPEEPVQLRAAVALLDNLLKVRDHHEVANRLAALEAATKETKRGTRR